MPKKKTVKSKTNEKDKIEIIKELSKQQKDLRLKDLRFLVVVLMGLIILIIAVNSAQENRLRKEFDVTTTALEIQLDDCKELKENYLTRIKAGCPPCPPAVEKKVEKSKNKLCRTYICDFAEVKNHKLVEVNKLNCKEDFKWC